MVFEVSFSDGTGDGISARGQRPIDHFGWNMTKNGGNRFWKEEWDLIRKDLICRLGWEKRRWFREGEVLMIQAKHQEAWSSLIINHSL